ncbi:uncharacterized protein PFL1_02865 [Pseudozyma flocculosa PF-1]|uniref:Related to GYP1 - cis-golgi GTPase-activating protein n=2 Tax=Pseudozyma flocculosa TaxID=84751 RepID=A0A5C3F1P8_9BASI|nr:uncharacterized protein PFL1_02865 [Pseudozyma flocculosa PF-1]EPQ29645.1 hypothetical protein PFL1_02865 [Pseudozyma flocculosa PF-1]SPO38212.1 related to GYP1 - cis-golgi GTPase-activating protein [Pseudozyma flocculosa]
MGSATVEEYIELLNAEQHVDLQKLRDYARHGTQPDVRGEVWLYLLGVLSDDKGQEMTSVRSKYLEYEQMDKHSPALEKRIRAECSRYYQKRLAARPPPGRSLMQSSRTIGSRPPGSTASASYSRLHSDGAGVAVGGASTSGSASNAIVVSLDRGPNRVNDGRIHALGGIIGDNGVTAAMDADDPEAVAAAELKRFGRSVENVICAYLNRYSHPSRHTREQSRGHGLGPHHTSLDRYGNSSTSSSIQGHSSDVDDPGLSQAHPSRSDGVSALESAVDATSSEDGSISRQHSAHVHHHNHHQQSQQHLHREREGPGSRSRSRAPSTGQTLEGSLKARMPREYEWMPQIETTRDDGTNAGPGSGLAGGGSRGGGAAGTPREFHPALVYLCAPFVKCIRVEAGMYFAFERLMTMMAEYNARKPLPLQVATFLTLFRTTLPELHSYFEEEEVDIISVATNWLQHLLAGELRIEDLMRLWDTYFAVADPIDLHLYVCIAILTNCKDSLEELDRSETRSMLYSLPPQDIDRVVNEAINIRLSHQQALREQEEETEEADV